MVRQPDQRAEETCPDSRMRPLPRRLVRQADQPANHGPAGAMHPRLMRCLVRQPDQRHEKGALDVADAAEEVLVQLEVPVGLGSLGGRGGGSCGVCGCSVRCGCINPGQCR